MTSLRVLPETEAGFTAAVIEYAQLKGWRTAHFRPARTGKGWVTPVQGDGAGWPDLFLIRGDRIVVAELKSGRGRLSPAQWAWLRAFTEAGIQAFVWGPRDWEELEAVLR